MGSVYFVSPSLLPSGSPSEPAVQHHCHLPTAPSKRTKMTAKKACAQATREAIARQPVCVYAQAYRPPWRWVSKLLATGGKQLTFLSSMCWLWSLANYTRNLWRTGSISISGQCIPLEPRERLLSYLHVHTLEAVFQPQDFVRVAQASARVPVRVHLVNAPVLHVSGTRQAFRPRHRTGSTCCTRRC